MKPLILRVVVVMFFTAALSSCSLTSDIRSKPLSDVERTLLGTWARGGLGYSHSYTFSEDRNVQYSGYTLIGGTTSGVYVWEADGSTISLYAPDAFFLEKESTIDYTLSSSDLLVMSGEEYSKQ